MSITLKPIGIIHTPFSMLSKIPRQSINAKNTKGMIELFPEYIPGLKRLKENEDIILLYYFHLSKHYSLKSKTGKDAPTNKGVFSSRSPLRPNFIGISQVHLIRIDKNKLYIENLDMMNSSPLLDIKPCLHSHEYKKKFKEK